MAGEPLCRGRRRSRETPVARVTDFDLYLICTQIGPLWDTDPYQLRVWPLMLARGPPCLPTGLQQRGIWVPVLPWEQSGQGLGCPGSGKRASCARLLQKRAGWPPGVLDASLQQKSQRDLSAGPPRTCNPRRSTPTARHPGTGPCSKQVSSLCSRGSRAHPVSRSCSTVCVSHTPSFCFCHFSLCLSASSLLSCHCLWPPRRPSLPPILPSFALTYLYFLLLRSVYWKPKPTIFTLPSAINHCGADMQTNSSQDPVLCLTWWSGVFQGLRVGGVSGVEG